MSSYESEDENIENDTEESSDIASTESAVKSYSVPDYCDSAVPAV